MFARSSLPRSGWTETILYAFTNGTGISPSPGIVLDQSGDVYAATQYTQNGGSMGGVVFELPPGGSWSYTQFYALPNQRIVQAWRTVSWDPGIYSIAKFELTEQGQDTKLAFDHTGFPEDQAQHLATGWHVNYWEPLAKYLS